MAEQKGVEIRFAAVLLAIYPMQGSWHALLMQRTKYPGVHSGQVSIPGGERESVDANLMETARREFKEEVGVSIPSDIIFGPLSERFIPPSRFVVSPYLAILPQRPHWNIDPKEVDSIIEFKVESRSTPDLISLNGIGRHGVKDSWSHLHFHRTHGPFCE